MSGIYIPGMKMPKGCGNCPFEIFGDCYGGKAKMIMDVEDYIVAGCRHPKCPLIPFHDHGRLIDADALISNYAIDKYDCSEVISVEDIRNAPTIITASKEEEA